MTDGGSEYAMRVLVTGATGFTGGHLARALHARGHRVRALVRDPAKGETLHAAGMEVVEGDLTNAAQVLQAVQGCEVVYHIAAVYREARFADEVYRQVNVDGTRNVLEACRLSGVGRVVHCSTVGVHGDVKAPADESAPFGPLDVYQESKLAGEQLARQYFDAGLPGTIFRPVGIHGPGDLRFHKLFRTIASGAFRMIGNGAVLYHMTYIDDLVAGIIRCGEHPAALGQTYILCGPRYTTITELAAAVARAVGRPAPRGHIPAAPVLAAAKICEAICRPLGLEPPLHKRRLDFFLVDRGFTSAKAAREIGYVPQVALEEGLERTAAWYKSAGLL
jgi:nucleoside-diphosphate-sugar epimerase